MAFSSFDEEDGTPLTEINMVPLIDVMLVLLIIFIITAPLLTHSVKVDLPKAQSQINQTPPEHIQIAIDAQGQVFWNGQSVDRNKLTDLMQATAQKDAQTELQLRADQAVPYRYVAQVMSEAARNGLVRIGFVTDPTAQ